MIYWFVLTYPHVRERKGYGWLKPSRALQQVGILRHDMSKQCTLISHLCPARLCFLNPRNYYSNNLLDTLSVEYFALPRRNEDSLSSSLKLSMQVQRSQTRTYPAANGYMDQHFPARRYQIWFYHT